MSYKKPKVPKQYRFPYGYPFQMNGKLPNGFIGWIALKHVDMSKTTYCYLTKRMLHKTDGPAVLEFYKKEFIKDGAEFWLENKMYSNQQEYWRHPMVVETKLKLILEIQ